VRILCVATKPPWPAIDGGRLALWQTVEALSDAGHEISLVAPDSGDWAWGRQAVDAALRVYCRPTVVAVRNRALIHLLPEALSTRLPLTVLRHHHIPVQDAVARHISEFCPDVVHVEQMQSFRNAEVALTNGYPVVLREQNVEADLWLQMARQQRFWAPMLRFEGRRLRQYEAAVVQRCTRTVTLTDRDAGELRKYAGASYATLVKRVGLPFPPQLAPGPPVEGAPAVVIGGSAGWVPNAQANRWFIRNAWPEVQRRLPQATLHVFGGDATGGASIRWHRPPVQSKIAFPAGAIMVVSLSVASGIRMRILEAWARGLPVVASSIAAAGLDVADGEQLLLANSADEFAAAIERLSRDTQLCERLRQGGTRYLRAHHDAARTTAALLDVYREAIDATA